MNGLWMLKNSHAESSENTRGARMRYKRSSPISYTFAATHFESVFGKTEFFNSHAC
jgi:hypothetical protein